MKTHAVNRLKEYAALVSNAEALALLKEIKSRIPLLRTSRLFESHRDMRLVLDSEDVSQIVKSLNFQMKSLGWTKTKTVSKSKKFSYFLLRSDNSWPIKVEISKDTVPNRFLVRLWVFTDDSPDDKINAKDLIVVDKYVKEFTAFLDAQGVNYTSESVNYAPKGARYKNSNSQENFSQSFRYIDVNLYDSTLTYIRKLLKVFIAGYGYKRQQDGYRKGPVEFQFTGNSVSFYIGSYDRHLDES